MALASSIKTAVATNPGFLIPTMKVEDRSEGIILHGAVRSIREQKAIDKEVRSVLGSVPMTFEIHCRGVKSIRKHRIS